jgi:1-acyl-sn-glycerol-3-phosphate acyltransferase
MLGAFRAALFHLYAFTIKAYQRLFLDLHVWGRENIPSGPKIYVSNHITSTDAFWVLPIFPERVHIVIGPTYHWRFMARLHDAYEQISAVPADRKTVVPKAVRFLRQGGAVWITPEGDLYEVFRLGRFYPGAARIYLQIQVPIVPIGLIAPKHHIRRYPCLDMVVEGRVYPMKPLLRGTYCINVGEPLWPEIPQGNPEKQIELITSLIKERIRSLMEEVRVNKFWL